VNHPSPVTKTLCYLQEPSSSIEKLKAEDHGVKQDRKERMRKGAAAAMQGQYRQEETQDSSGETGLHAKEITPSGSINCSWLSWREEGVWRDALLGLWQVQGKV